MLGKRCIDNLNEARPKYTCGYCRKVFAFKLQRCNGSGGNAGFCPVRYCSVKCQEGGWPRHRRQCLARKKAKLCPAVSSVAGPSSAMEVD